MLLNHEGAFAAFHGPKIRQKTLKIIEVTYFFDETRALDLILQFRYFKLQNIYKRFLICKRIPIFSSELIHK